jgi:uncharacterized protein YjbJ (UPF0337 family)
MGEGSDPLMRDDDSTTFGSDAVGREDDATTTPETAEIRANIEQTRADMSEKIEAIQERLSPQHIKDQVTSTVREATIGKAEDMMRSASEGVYEARSTLMETIRQNPIPAAMVGIGLGWLFMNRRSAPHHDQRRYNDARYYDYDARDYGAEGAYRSYGARDPYYERERQGLTGRAAHRAQDAVGSAAGRAQEAVGHAQHAAGRAAERAQDAVGGAVSQAQDAVGHVANRAQQTASSLASRTQYQAMRMEDRFESAMFENPLTMGAIALAVGAAVGLAAPGTERENRLMGEARDTLVERAAEVAQDTVEKVQNVAGQVADEAQNTARSAAREQGLKA